MAKNAGEDHVQVRGALCGHEEGRFAKDGLIQYRIVCQQVNVSSLEEVIKYFLQLSSEQAEQAQAQAAEVMLDIEDLEAEKRPEDLMLSYVCGEKGRSAQTVSLLLPGSSSSGRLTELF
jgi:translation initiation factor 3 subunit A